MHRIRDDIDYNQPINLKRLNPLKRITTAACAKFRETEYARKSRNRAMDAKYAAMEAKDNILKNALLAIIYAELENNNSLKSINGVEEEIILEVQSEYIYSLNRIISSSEFLLYNLQIIEEEENFRRCFEDMPILLRVNKRRMVDA